MKYKILATSIVLASTWFATPTKAQNVELVNELLETKECRSCNLFGVSLTNTDLNRAILGEAILTTADLSGTNLSSAFLRGAYLRYTNLSNAILRSVNLSHAVLTSPI